MWNQCEQRKVAQQERGGTSRMLVCSYLIEI